MCVVVTGLYNLRARLYTPATGRFLSRDTFDKGPGNPSELNRYVYTANNPVNASDPTGLVAAIEYHGTLGPSEKMAKDHARYVNGIDFSKGPDAVALFTASVLAAVADQLIATILSEVLLRDIPEQGWELPFGD